MSHADFAQMPTEFEPQECLNFNIGILGHVDSGKTSLCMALSQITSTACFDRNPQSRERGITIDLGFSSFVAPMPDHLLNSASAPLKFVQYTLVDCPGHASLVRTIMGGAQIIDLMLLVIDVTKGIQTQTAECLVIGEITCPTDRMLVVLNKIDLLAADETVRTAEIDKLRKRVKKALSTTRFAHAKFVCVSARPAGGEIALPTMTDPIGIHALMKAISEETYLPLRSSKGPFIFAADHCFTVKGQGTVMTGTVLSGQISVDDEIEIPALVIRRKVKSIQRFRKPVRSIMQGHRAGVCVTQFDASLFERGFACAPPNTLRNTSAVVCTVRRIAYFKQDLHSKMRLHITCGHSTVIGTMTFFQPASSSSTSTQLTGEDLFKTEHAYIETVPVNDNVSDNTTSGEENSDASNTQALKSHQQKYDPSKPLLALIVFEQPTIVAEQFMLIASKLDTDIHLNKCRLAFYGPVLYILPTAAGPQSEQQQRAALGTLQRNLRIFRDKFKRGTIERLAGNDESSVIVRNMFKKETDLTRFCNMPVTLSTGEKGVIESGFGQSGKVKVSVPGGLKPETLKQLDEKSAGKAVRKGPAETAGDAKSSEPMQQKTISVLLTFRKYYYGPDKEKTSK